MFENTPRTALATLPLAALNAPPKIFPEFLTTLLALADEEEEPFAFAATLLNRSSSTFLAFIAFSFSFSFSFSSFELPPTSILILFTGCCFVAKDSVEVEDEIPRLAA